MYHEHCCPTLLHARKVLFDVCEYALLQVRSPAEKKVLVILLWRIVITKCMLRIWYWNGHSLEGHSSPAFGELVRAADGNA